MLFTLSELIDLVIMIVAIGYIFSTLIRREPLEGYDPLTYFRRNSLMEDIKHGALIAAPAIVFHELAHKFVAMAFGATAVLHAPLGWYAAVIIMRLLNFPLFFFVGGYVTHTPLPPLESAIVSLSGPLVNLILYLVCVALPRFNIVHRKYYKLLGAAGKINLFLALFNIIPLPGFDGFNAMLALLHLFF